MRQPRHAAQVPSLKGRRQLAGRCACVRGLLLRHERLLELLNQGAMKQAAEEPASGDQAAKKRVIFAEDEEVDAAGRK
jgi:hypothetical protein